jgi:hypothetical protein
LACKPRVTRDLGNSIKRWTEQGNLKLECGEDQRREPSIKYSRSLNKKKKPVFKIVPEKQETTLRMTDSNKTIEYKPFANSRSCKLNCI